MMPLKSGSSRSAVSSNIRELISSGRRPRDQAVAIALSKARRRADGGAVTTPVGDGLFDLPKTDKGDFHALNGYSKAIRATGEFYAPGDAPASMNGPNVSTVAKTSPVSTDQNPPTRIDLQALRDKQDGVLTTQDVLQNVNSTQSGDWPGEIESPIDRLRLELSTAKQPDEPSVMDHLRVAAKASRAGDMDTARMHMAAAESKALGWLPPNPGTAAQGAASRVGVFVPAFEKEAAARELKDQLADTSPQMRKGIGRLWDNLFGKTQFGTEGRLKEELSDAPMSIKPGVARFQPGDERYLGDTINHPELFDRYPDLPERVLKFGKANTGANQGSASIADDGSYLLRPRQYGSNRLDNWVKDNVAKLTQYDIQGQEGFAKAVGHNPIGTLNDIDQTMRAVKAGIAAGKIDAAEGARYSRMLKGYQDQIMVRLNAPGGVPLDNRTNASKFLSANTAGNLEAKAARDRRASPNASMPSYGGQWEKSKLVLPQSVEDVPGLVSGWSRYGAGSPGFARGGRIKSSTLTKARNYATGGALRGGTPGRSDKLPVKVGAGAYVIPADVVSALGEGNSVAGHDRLEKSFPSRKGGKSTPVNIIVSDGEFIVSPDHVAKLGGGDVNKGHDVLDQFVKGTRAQNIQTLQNMAPPKQ